MGPVFFGPFSYFSPEMISISSVSCTLALCSKHVLQPTLNQGGHCLDKSQPILAWQRTDFQDRLYIFLDVLSHHLLLPWSGLPESSCRQAPSPLEDSDPIWTSFPPYLSAIPWSVDPIRHPDPPETPCTAPRRKSLPGCQHSGSRQSAFQLVRRKNWQAAMHPGSTDLHIKLEMRSITMSV